MKRFSRLLFVPLLGFLLAAHAAATTPHEWVGRTGVTAAEARNWGIAGNWSGGILPAFDNQTDLVWDTNTGAGTSLSFLGANRTARSITLGSNLVSGSTTYDFRFNAGGGATDTPGRHLTFAADSGNATLIMEDEYGKDNAQVMMRFGNNNNNALIILASDLDVHQHSTHANLMIEQPITESGGPRTITKYGLGNLEFRRNNTSWTGALNIFEGPVTFFNDPRAGSGSIFLGETGSENDVTLLLGGFSAAINNGNFTRDIVVNSGDGARTIRNLEAANPTIATGNIDLSAGKDVTVDAIAHSETLLNISISSTVTGSGGIIKTGSGRLTLWNVGNTYEGGTAIEEGTLLLENVALPGTGPITIAEGATLHSGTNAAFNAALRVLPNDISGEGQLIQTAGTTRLLGDVTHTGGTTIDGGQLRVGHLSETGSLAGDVLLNAGTFAFARTDEYTFDGVISGNNPGGASLSKVAAGTLILTGDNTFVATTQIFEGVLVAGHENALGNGGNISFRGLAAIGQLRYTAASAGTDWSPRIINSENAISIDTDGNDVTWATGLAASNAAGLIKDGAGTLTLNGTNAYSGPTLVNEGTLALGSNGAITVSNRIIIAEDGILDASAATAGVDLADGQAIGGAGTVIGDVIFREGAGFVFSATDTLTINGDPILFEDFGISDVLDLDETVENGTYTLFNGTVDAGSTIRNLGASNAESIGEGKVAYFDPNTLDLVVADESAAIETYEEWADRFGLVGADRDENADPDGDGLTNWEEYLFGTDPTDPASRFEIAMEMTEDGFAITFDTVEGREYQVARSTNLVNWEPVGSTVIGDGTPAEVIDTDTPADRAFYRVQVALQ